MTRRRRSQVMYVYSGPTDRWPLGEPAEMFPVPQPGAPLAGSPSGPATSVRAPGPLDSSGPRIQTSHGLSPFEPESTRGSLPDNQEGRYGGRSIDYGHGRAA